MGILQRVLAGTSSDQRLLGKLADLAGRNQELAERLGRHAGLCSYPNIASGLAELANREARHAHALSALLAERHAWSKLPRPMGAEGSSNWERATGDLALLLEIVRDMNQQVIGWERVDPPFAARLRAIMLEHDRDLGKLRELALRCDPQALD